MSAEFDAQLDAARGHESEIEAALDVAKQRADLGVGGAKLEADRLQSILDALHDEVGQVRLERQLVSEGRIDGDVEALDAKIAELTAPAVDDAPFELVPSLSLPDDNDHAAPDDQPAPPSPVEPVAVSVDSDPLEDVTVEPEPEPEPSEPVKPEPEAPTEAWRGYAVALGASPDDVVDMGRDELVTLAESLVGSAPAADEPANDAGSAPETPAEPAASDAASGAQESAQSV